MNSAMQEVLNSDLSGAVRALGDLAERTLIALARQRQIVEDTSARWAVVPTETPDGAVRWWLISDDNESERTGREVVNAFFGPAIRRAGRQAGPLNGSASRLSAIPNVVDLHVEGDPLPFVEMLELMTSVRAGAPDREWKVPDSIGFLLRDFYLALDRGDADAAEDLLSRIESTGLLGSENLRFLRVDRLARLGRWRELQSLPWFEELARARRPIRISEHLLEAVWALYFDDAIAASDLDATFRAYDEAEIASRFGALLQSVDVPSTTAGRRVAVLFAHRSGDGARVERIVDAAPVGERGLLERLAGRIVEVEAQPEGTPLDASRDLFDDGNYEQVVRIAEAEQSSPLVALAVRASFEQNDPRLAQRVVPLVDAMPAAELPGSMGFMRMIEAVRRLADNACASWSAWLERVGSDVRWPDAAEVARDLSGTWEVGELSRSSVADAAAEQLLAGSENVNRREVRAIFDLLCDLAGQLASSPSADRFVDAVLLALASDENPSAPLRAAFFDLLTDVLASGPSSDRYGDILATTESLWSRVRSREAMRWILDVLDVFASQPSPDESARQNLVANVVASTHEFASRLTPDERTLFEEIGRECHVDVELPPIAPEIAAETMDVWSHLRGKLVGVYSLVPGVGLHLKERLAVLCDTVEVEQNSDTVATAALRALATTADFFLVDTKHASHAATGAIDAVRPRDQQLFPTGGGVSSFIARLREALEPELASAA